LNHRPHRSPWQGTNGKASISSPDPLLLSSSPRMYHADVDVYNSCPTGHTVVLQMTSSMANLDQDPGTGPDATPSLSMPQSSPEARSQQLSPDPFTVHAPPTLDVNDNGTLTIENEASAAGGRYSMRTRQPRQLQPYAFDRLEYKHQLKHHPDAIVKFIGRRSPVESSSPPGDVDTDGAAESSAGEHPAEYARMVPHSKGRKRYRASTGHPSAPPPVAHRRTSGPELFSGSPPLGGRYARSSAIADGLVTSIPDVGGDDSQAEAVTWYPDAFNDLSSGQGSDDMPLSTPQNDMPDNHIFPQRVKRRRVFVTALRWMSIG
jgi:hypothetical protein